MSRHRDDLVSDFRELGKLLERIGSGPDASVPRVVAAFDVLTDLAEYGYPRGGSGGGRAGGHSDPTQATAFDEARQDEARRLLMDRDEMADAVSVAKMKLQLALRHQEAVLAPKLPIKHKAGCENCDTVKGDDGRPHHLSYQPVKARDLCGWCYRFQYGDGADRPGYGVPPVYAILRWHLDHLGEEVTPRMVRDHMPVEFAAREERKRRPGTCCHPTGKDGAPCAREFMHDGICSPVALVAS